jgi:hypothetical protein
MNPHRRYKSYMQASDLLLITLPIILVLFAVFGLNPFHRKNIDKLKPIDRQTISTNNITGNVESIHPWGRTEVVPMKSIKLKYFQYCDEWVMYGEVEQPIGRKDYFMPVMKGHLDLNVKDLTQTWIEYGGYATGPEKDAETYEDFRMAHIKVNSGKVVNIKYSHYRLDQNKTWSIIAVWEARFNENL